MNLFALDTATALAFAVSVLIPAVSALLARPRWPAGVVGLTTLALTTLNGFLTEWADSPDASHYHWQQAAGIAFTSYIIAALAHFQLWKGTATEAKLRSI